MVCLRSLTGKCETRKFGGHIFLSYIFLYKLFACVGQVFALDDLPRHAPGHPRVVQVSRACVFTT